MAIVWRNEMTVGNEAVDNEHKYLISLINVIEAGVLCNVGAAPLLDFMDLLIEYSKTHFEREQELQKKILFPLAGQHRELHQGLIRRIQEIKEELASLPGPEAYDRFTRDLFSLLHDWLLDHVLEEDLKMRQYFKQFDALV